MAFVGAPLAERLARSVPGAGSKHPVGGL